MQARKTPIAYYGGKQSLLRDILPLIPEHHTYLEPFFGGGAVFFAKVPSPMEVINDLNKEVMNFYLVLRSAYYHELTELIQGTLQHRSTYEDAKVVYNNPHLFTSVKRAWAFWVLTQIGFSSQVGSFAVDKAKNSTSLKLTNKKEAWSDHYRHRLEHVQIEWKDAPDVIRRYDSADTVFYVDPPYFNSDCGHYSGYTEANYRELLDHLAAVKGKFMLSCYNSDPLQEYAKLHAWKIIYIEKNISVTYLSKRKKTELIVMNYE